jgi:hypothetical protein
LLISTFKRLRRREQSIAPIPELSAQFEVRERFLSEAALRLHVRLCRAVHDFGIVCPKPRVFEILRLLRAAEHLEDALRIDRKHIDFLICDATSGRPLCAVQIDQWDPLSQSYQMREELLHYAFERAGFPVIYVRSDQLPSGSELRQLIDDAVAPNPDRQVVVSHAIHDAVGHVHHSGRVDAGI